MAKNDKHTDLLIRYVRGEASEEERNTIEQMLRDDPSLRESLTILRSFAEMGESSEEWSQIEAAAERLSDRLFADFEKAKLSPEVPTGVTVYDSKFAPLPDGVRPAPVDHRDLRIKVGNDTVDIACYPVGLDSYEVLGKVTAESVSGVKVTAQSSKKTAEVVTDEFGLFRFARLDARTYRIVLTSDDSIKGVFDLEL